MCDSNYFEPLTNREQEVLAVLVETGSSNRIIGEQLFITEATVEQHLYQIYQKLRVTNRTEAALQAIRLGLVDI